jgi:hypothetical protein
LKGSVTGTSVGELVGAHTEILFKRKVHILTPESEQKATVISLKNNLFQEAATRSGIRLDARSNTNSSAAAHG